MWLRSIFMGYLDRDTYVWKEQVSLGLNDWKEVKVTESVQLCSKEDIVVYYQLWDNVSLRTLMQPKITYIMNSKPG